jgi:hypothetical protein
MSSLPTTRPLCALVLCGLLALGCRDNGESNSPQGGAAAVGGSLNQQVPGSSGSSGGPPAVSGGAGGGQLPAAGGSSGPAPSSGSGGGAPAGQPPDAGAVGDAGEPDASIPDSAAGDPPATGTFPDVSDLSADGPFTAMTVRNTGPGSAYTLFHPQELAPDGIRNPIVSWGNGGATTPVDYDYLLPHLATHGFVVIAANSSTVTGELVRGGIDWIVEQNDVASSPFFQKLDVDNVAGVGYSLGGLATYQAAEDPRFVTIVIISGGAMSEPTRSEYVANLHTPTAYLCTADAASRGNCEGDYAIIDVPAFFGVLNDSVHTSVTEFLGLGAPAIMERLAGAVTAWLRWHQMADISREPMFLGDDCELCRDPNWTVEPQKNWK